MLSLIIAPILISREREREGGKRKGNETVKPLWVFMDNLRKFQTFLGIFSKLIREERVSSHKQSSERDVKRWGREERKEIPVSSPRCKDFK